MLSSQHPENPRNDLPEPSTLDELIARAVRLREDVMSIRREESVGLAPHGQRWTAWEEAVHRLDGVGEQLRQLRAAGEKAARSDAGERVGSAEWSLLTDGVWWSPELFVIFGRMPAEGPLTLDELPSCLVPEDQPVLTSAVTGCLIDGRPVGCEFRVLLPDRSPRTVRMTGQPVLDEAGGTVAMYAVIREVSEPPASQESGEARPRPGGVRQGRARATEREWLVTAPWSGASAPAPGSDGAGSVELAAHYLSGGGAAGGGVWWDSLALPDGSSLLSVGDLTGHGAAEVAQTAMAVGGLRSTAWAGAGPGPLLANLNQVLDQGTLPLLASVVCCRYEPDERTLTWAQAGHPAPLLFRGGVGRALPRPAGPLLGTVSDAVFEEHTEPLELGDVLVLYTDELFPSRPPGGPPGSSGDPWLLSLAAKIAPDAGATAWLRAIVSTHGGRRWPDDACVLVVSISS